MKRFVTWLELAFSAVSSREQAKADVVVRSLDMGRAKPCFGVTLGRRWLRSSDGALTVFDSLAAVSLFLHLLKVEHFTMSESLDDAGVQALETINCCRLVGRRFEVCDNQDCTPGMARLLVCRPKGRLEERQLAMH